MSQDSKIEWTNKTWNPVRGCSRVSLACQHCYAETVANRFSGPGMPYEGLIHLVGDEPRWSGVIQLVPERLRDPLSWRKPQRVFVNSMSDLFHEDVPDEFIDRVFAVMKVCPQHTFQILTKRPERMRDYMDPNTRGSHLKVSLACQEYPKQLVRAIQDAAFRTDDPLGYRDRGDFACVWPLPNVWLGVSVEDQQRADERIPALLATPAAVRFLSVEPLLSTVDVTAWLESAWSHDPDPNDRGQDCPALDWVIIGGESGPHARPCDVAWIRSLVEQCRAASVPAFVKQLGAYPIEAHPLDPKMDRVQKSIRLRDPKGGDMTEWPADLRVRQSPEVT